MLEIFKENPYSLLGISVAVDVFILAIFSTIQFRKNDNKTALKKIAIIIALMIIVDGCYGFYVYRTHTFYDKNAEHYSSLEDVVYYEESGRAFKLDGKYFVSIDGTVMFLADRAYVSEDGYLYYDKNGNIEQTNLECIYKDADGNKYYKATEVKWNSCKEVELIIN